jgi:hypothetical protein
VLSSFALAAFSPPPKLAIATFLGPVAAVRRAIASASAFGDAATSPNR